MSTLYPGYSTGHAYPDCGCTEKYPYHPMHPHHPTHPHCPPVVPVHAPAPLPFMPVAPQLAEAYVPYQQEYTKLPPREALYKGTLFPELYRPYVPKRR